MPNAPRRRGPEQPAPESDAPAAIDPLAYTWLVALGMMAIGAIAGMLFLHYRNPPATSSAIAAVLVLVAAIERVLEPLVHFQLLGADPATAASPAETRTLWTIRMARCLGLAAALAMLACGFFGFGVVHAFGDSATPRYIDVIVTGLGIGALTKPWHDIVRGLERWAHAPR